MDAAEIIHEKFVAKVGGGTLPRRVVDLAPGAVGLRLTTDEPAAGAKANGGAA